MRMLGFDSNMNHKILPKGTLVRDRVLAPAAGERKRAAGSAWSFSFARETAEKQV